MDTEIEINKNRQKITDLMSKREQERQENIQKKQDVKNKQKGEIENLTYFNETFNIKCNDIENLLQSASNAEDLNVISKNLQLLQKFVADSTIFIRNYDVRICQGTLTDLEQQIHKVEENLLPKKKFGFKNKRDMKIKPANDETDSRILANNHINKDISNEYFFGFKSLQDKNLVLEKDSLEKRDVSLQHLQNCTVKLLGNPSTVHMSNLNGCTIICGPVSTSVFAEHCSNNKFVLACQQLRLHNSVDCDIYLHVTSRAIIEDCKEIKVAPYTLIYDGLRLDFEKSGLDHEVNNWNKLDDFNWLVADKKSPNWSILGEEHRTTWNV